MPRVNLSLSDELFSQIEEVAKKDNTTVNLVILNNLEKMFLRERIDYNAMLNQLLIEIDLLPDDTTEFTLYDLPTFRDISMSKITDGSIKPSPIRARLGKAFNELERRNGIKGVSRASITKKDGTTALKFSHRAAVYVLNRNERHEEEL